MNTRILAIKRGCKFCREMVRKVNRLNTRLPIEKRIKIIDFWEKEEFDLDNIALEKTLNNIGLKEGFPFLYIDKIIFEQGATPEQTRIMLETFLKEDFI